MWKSRTQLLLGEEKIRRMATQHVLIVGVGGVGAYAAEMLCRAGIGKMTIVDGDTVNASNLNRQLVALHSTIGMPKTEVLSKRLLDINPDLELTVINEFIKDERIPEILDAAPYDFVVDAIDTLSPKVFLIQNALQRGLKIISSMGAGAKTDPTQIKITDVSKSYNCTLARAVRKRLNKLEIKEGFPVVFSSELADENAVILCENEQNKVSTVGTISYMPATFGNYIASYVIREI
jgi:tRNA A37 threonylcarbamoyladenosine dehydratase